MANNAHTFDPNQVLPAPQAPQAPQPGYSFQAPITAPVTGTGHVQYGGGFSRVNSTPDPRILWEDGHVAVILGKDFPAMSGMGRTQTRKTLQEVLNATIEPTRQGAPGSGSANDLVKVWLKDLLARPVPGMPNYKAVVPVRGRVPTPMVASGNGDVPKGTLIPDSHYPNQCKSCGGWYYSGSGEHPTPDGKCPANSIKRK